MFMMTEKKKEIGTVKGIGGQSGHTILFKTAHQQ